MPETNSQNTAPGPPNEIAVATPAMFPTPTVDPSAVASAWNDVTVPSASSLTLMRPNTNLIA